VATTAPAVAIGPIGYFNANTGVFTLIPLTELSFNGSQLSTAGVSGTADPARDDWLNYLAAVGMITPGPATATITSVASPPAPVASGPMTGGTSVTITGSGFVNATTVNFGAAASVIQGGGTDTQLVVLSPAGTPGPVDVTVITPAGVSSIVTADQFTYVAVPTITSLSASTGNPGGGDSLTINGSDLTGATAVNFGTGNPGTGLTVVNDGQIKVTTPSGNGIVTITVVRGTDTSPTVAAAQFSYVPSITSLSPATGTQAGKTLVTISGVGLTGATSVKFNGVAGTIQTTPPPTDTQLVAATAEGSGSGAVIVVATAGSTPSNPNATFSYYAPTIATIYPTTGPKAGGTAVFLTGSQLGDVETVTFGGAPATIQYGRTDTQMVVTSPAGGEAQIAATSVGGAPVPITQSNNEFNYT
jgi:large repetitive protein